MALDVSRVEYDTDKKKKPKKNVIADEESIRLNEESARRSAERYKQKEWQPIKLSELDTNTQTNTD